MSKREESGEAKKRPVYVPQQAKPKTSKKLERAKYAAKTTHAYFAAAAEAMRGHTIVVWCSDQAHNYGTGRRAQLSAKDQAVLREQIAESMAA
jgi:hypothetical protein